CQLARFGRHPVNLTARSPRTINDVRVFLDNLGRFLGGDLGLSHDEIAFFGSKVWQIVTSCRDRRMNEYEKIGWWDFIGAEQRSGPYQKLLGHGITRSLVAAKARTASTKTIGNIFVQLLFDIVTPGASTDRVLNGPTNDVWIHPWMEYLKSKGVRYYFESEVKAVAFDGERIRNATISRAERPVTVNGDHFIFAMPVEDVIDLVTPDMIKAEPRLAHLFTLDDITEWMNGIQIYLREDVPISHGHTVYVDSPWALTSISQAQFWDHVNFSDMGDGAVKGIISVDISEWEEKGLNGKAAKDCTEEEIKAEVWEQMKRSLNFGDTVVLKDEQLHRWSLDPDIRIHGGLDGTTANEEPLLVNLVDTWKLRPEAVTRIPNLFLASDYVRTNTDLATMEGANEAARRAVNGILKASGSEAAPCAVWDLHEPEMFAPWRELDHIRYAQGLAWDDSLVRIGLSVAGLLDKAIVALEHASEKHDIFESGGGVGLAATPSQVASLIDRNAHGGVTSDLRRDATLVVERLGKVVAQRLAEAQRSGRVQILPR
ncbi:MAG: hydroxysqualene dehydroxylase, partial [Thermoanaerobaculia bacterium]